ncbi:MAG: autotransporter outer membrane beta-barrel domain-containing protein [Myxococcaceae bacterium]|nr:autotransporter outer membrane beta-barrel domain-containing protein [Myxococcaceae bacterium]
MSRRVASELSRSGAALACALALGAGGAAWAQPLSPSASSSLRLMQDPGDASSASVESEAPSGSSHKLGLGVMLDVGAPDGVGVSAVLRPLQWLRINAGLTTNTLSLGLRGGLSLVPLSSFISPSLNVDFGHYLDAKYNDLVDRLGNLPLQTDLPVENVGFNYLGASLGLEIGKPERFSFFLRVGLAHGSMTINEAEALLRDVTGDPDITAQPLTFRFTTPSVKLGFLLYFF